MHLSADQNMPFPRALSLAGSSGMISAQGKQGLALLDQHLQGICYGIGPWSMLASYLFTRSGYLDPLLVKSSYKGQQQRLSIYQFLLFAHEQDRLVPAGEDRMRSFLGLIRRLEILGEEKQLRQLPYAASGIDAVRLMTVHASKGLEFRGIPSLFGTGHVSIPPAVSAMPPSTRTDFVGQ